jgi:hypothetical protein
MKETISIVKAGNLAEIFGYKGKVKGQDISLNNGIGLKFDADEMGYKLSAVTAEEEGGEEELPNDIQELKRLLKNTKDSIKRRGSTTKKIEYQRVLESKIIALA